MTIIVRLVRDTLVLPLIPVAIGAAIARATRSAGARRTIAAIAVAAGIVIAHVVDVGVPQLPPVDTIGWIPAATALAAAGLLVERRRAARLLVAFIVATTAAWLIGRPVWTAAGGAPWVLVAGAIAAAVVGSLEVADRSVPRAATLLAVAMTMAGGSIACLLAHSARLAQVLGASAAVVGASGLAALFFEPAKTTASIAVISAVALVVYARLYATLSVPALGLLAASSVAPLLAASLPLGRRGRAVASVVLAAVLGAAAACGARAMP